MAHRGLQNVGVGSFDTAPRGSGSSRDTAAVSRSSRPASPVDGEVHHARPRSGRARESYRSASMRNLDFRKGDPIRHIVPSDLASGWYEGTNARSGRQGIFPAHMVELSEAAPSDASDAAMRSRARPPGRPARAKPPPALIPTGGPIDAAVIEDALVAGGATPPKRPTRPTRPARPVGGPAPPPPDERYEAYTKGDEDDVEGEEEYDDEAPPSEYELPEVAMELTGTDQALFTELDATVQRWRDQMLDALRGGDEPEALELQNLASSLLDLRTKLQGSIRLKQPEQQEAVRKNILKLTEARREVENAFAVPRTASHSFATYGNCSVAELLTLHSNMQRSMNEGSIMPVSAAHEHEMQVQRGIRPALFGFAKAAGAYPMDAEEAFRQRRAEEQVASQADLDLERTLLRFQLLRCSLFCENDAEVFAFLWKPPLTEDEGLGEVVSEDFRVELDASGEPPPLSATFFTGLRRGELSSLVLVLRFYCKGALGGASTPGGPGTPGAARSMFSFAARDTQRYQKPLGVAVLRLASIADQLEGSPGAEHVADAVAVFQPPTALGAKGELAFPSLHFAALNVLDRDASRTPSGGGGIGSPPMSPQTSGMEPSPRGGSVSVSLTALHDPSSGAPWLHDASLAASGPRPPAKEPLPPTPRADFLPAVHPAEARNDLLVTIVGGDFSQGSKSSAMNILFSAFFVDGQGRCLRRMRRGGSAFVDSYDSSVFYHCNAPRTDESVALALPGARDELSGLHLLLLATHCSSSKASTPFAFAFLRLAKSGGALLEDGEHTLEVFDVVEGVAPRGGTCDPRQYLRPGVALSRRRKGRAAFESIKVRTRAVSAIHASVRCVHELFTWTERDSARLAQAIKEAAATPPHEFVRHTADVFDTLTAMLRDPRAAPLRQRAFALLCGLLHAYGGDGLRGSGGRSAFESYAAEMYGGGARRENSAMLDMQPLWQVLLESAKQLLEALSEEEDGRASGDPRSTMGSPRRSNFKEAQQMSLTRARKLSGGQVPMILSAGEQRRALSTMVKSLEYLLLLCRCSLERSRDEVGPARWQEQQQEYLLSLSHVFDRLSAFLRQPRDNAPTWHRPLKQEAIKAMGGALRVLCDGHFPAEALGHAFANFLASMPPRDADADAVASRKPSKNVANQARATQARLFQVDKLELLGAVVDSPLFRGAGGAGGGRPALLPEVLSILKQHFDGSPEERSAALRVAVLVLDVCETGGVPTEVDACTEALFAPLFFCAHRLRERELPGAIPEEEEPLDVDAAGHGRRGSAASIGGESPFGSPFASPDQRAAPEAEAAGGEPQAAAPGESDLALCSAALLQIFNAASESKLARLQTLLLVHPRRRRRARRGEGRVDPRLLSMSSMTSMSLPPPAGAAGNSPSSVMNPPGGEGFEAVSVEATVLAMEGLWDGSRQPTPLSALHAILLCLRLLAVAPPYPQSWVSVRMLCLAAATKWVVAASSAAAIVGSLADGEDEAELAVREGLVLLVLELVQHPLLNAGPPAASDKAGFISTHFADMKAPLCGALRAFWAAQDEDVALRSVGHAASEIVPKVLGVMAAGDAQVRDLGCDLYFDLLRKEYAATGAFKEVGSATMDCFDEMVQTAARRGELGSERASQRVEGMAAAASPLTVAFSETLLRRFEGDRLLAADDAKAALQEIHQLYALLADMQRFPPTPEFEEERCHAYEVLMMWCRKHSRQDLYLRYAHGLKREQIRLGHHTQAAMALMLHARSLPWRNDVRLPVWRAHGGEDGGAATAMKAQSAAARKEALYDEAVQYLLADDCWEGAVALTQELVEYHRGASYEWKDRLPKLLRNCADYHERIATSERFFPSLFRVSYFGEGFPQELRNAEFVYSGDKLESLIDFCARLKRRFPEAVMLPPKVDASEEYTKSPLQFLQVSKVSASLREEVRVALESEDSEQLAALPTLAMPKLVREGASAFGQRWFHYTRPFKKRPKEMGKPMFKGVENEFLDLWIQQRFLLVEAPVPGTTRRARVLRRVDITLNPLENAVQSVTDKNSQLEQLINEAQASPGEASQAFSMAINGTVDSAVNGGTKMYEPFVTGEYARDFPEIHEDVIRKDGRGNPEGAAARLRDALEKQLQLLKRGVRIHGRKCSEMMRPLHEHIQSRFVEMEREFKTLLA